MVIVLYFVRVIGFVIILASLIPFIRNDYWIFRVFEYPRLQKLFLSIALLIALSFLYPWESLVDKALAAALLINLIYLCYLVFPFTAIARKQLIASSELIKENSISLLIANVFQYNKQSGDYQNLITNCNPDVILLVETNHWWEQQMLPVEKQYPYQIKMPLENTYGMLLYSRLELVDGQVNFLVEEDIPSIEVNVRLHSGQLVKLYCLHPQPPVPQENPRSTERDKEILLVGEKAKDADIPVVVVGDLNDVAWSYTTELFCKTSGLLDPRRGRGFYNSFNAKYFFLRFPLDHIFCSDNFSLNAIKRMPRCGSDHFPMYINLQFNPTAVTDNQKLEVTADDRELAKEKITANT